MKRICLYLALIVFTNITALAQSPGSKTHHLRTDGFYLYDNGLDTIVTIPGGSRMQIEAFNMMKQKGYINKDEVMKDEDTVAKNSEGTTEISFIVFFNDSDGTALSTLYRHKDPLGYFMNIMNSRKAITPVHAGDITVRMTDILFTSDSTLTFSIGKNDPDREKKFECVLTKDGMRVGYTRTVAPWHQFPVHDYTFIPFDKIPANLFAVKKQ